MLKKIKSKLLSYLNYNSNLSINDIFLTKRGNESIKKSLFIAKSLGKTKVFIADQGGWMTYPQFIKKAGLEEIRLITNDCKINLDNLRKVLDSNSVLLVNALSGYWYKQNMKEISNICKDKSCLLITDLAGGIGDPSLSYGDILIGSFGRWKPINNYGGGFIATNLDNDILDTFEGDLDSLNKHFLNLNERINFLNSKSIGLMKQLSDSGFNFLNNLDNNLNRNLVVIALFKSEVEKKELINLANSLNIEYTECPREIRSLRDGISFELKKLN